MCCCCCSRIVLAWYILRLVVALSLYGGCLLCTTCFCNVFLRKMVTSGKKKKSEFAQKMPYQVYLTTSTYVRMIYTGTTVFILCWGVEKHYYFRRPLSVDLLELRIHYPGQPLTACCRYIHLLILSYHPVPPAITLIRRTSSRWL